MSTEHNDSSSRKIVDNSGSKNPTYQSDDALDALLSAFENSADCLGVPREFITITDSEIENFSKVTRECIKASPSLNKVFQTAAEIQRLHRVDDETILKYLESTWEQDPSTSDDRRLLNKLVALQLLTAEPPHLLIYKMVE